MDVHEAIRTRRSVRSYTPERISELEVEALLRAAMQAPSAANQQAWHFVVIDERSLLDRVPEFHPYCAFIREAPMAIAVCGDLGREKFGGKFWVQDCSAATQNLLLEAHALGLGAVWLAVYPIDERVRGVRDLLNLPDTLVPLNLVCLGHPSKAVPPADRFDAGRVSRNVLR